MIENKIPKKLWIGKNISLHKDLVLFKNTEIVKVQVIADFEKNITDNKINKD